MQGVEVEQLTVHYSKVPVLWDVHFAIPKGTLLAIVGPNGAGKSTLLKAMLGIVKRVAGSVRLDGVPFEECRGSVAYVPQKSSVDWNFPITVLDLVLMGRYRKLGWFKWPKLCDRQAARRALALVGMEAFEARQISELSGGQQQRLFIARALLQEADIYFLDEPFAGVDMTTEEAIWQLLKRLKSEGKTVLVVHHDLSTVESTFDWALLLNTSVIACGPIGEVFHQENIFRTYGKSPALLEEVYRAQEGLVNLYEARQSQIGAQQPERRRPSSCRKGEEEGRFGKVAASTNSPNLTERGKTRLSGEPPK